MKKFFIVITGFLIGLLITTQYIAYKKINALVSRDTSSNIFSEIQFYQNTIKELNEEISSLENQKKQINDSYSVRQAILEEIKKDELLSGKVRTVGPGLTITINNLIDGMWMVDLLNELWTAGAEGISLNNIRLTNQVSGIMTVNQKQIIVNGSLILAPLNLKVIGEKNLLRQAVNQGGGIIPRLKSVYPDIDIKIEDKDLVEM